MWKTAAIFFRRLQQHRELQRREHAKKQEEVRCLNVLNPEFVAFIFMLLFRLWLVPILLFQEERRQKRAEKEEAERQRQLEAQQREEASRRAKANAKPVRTTLTEAPLNNFSANRPSVSTQRWVFVASGNLSECSYLGSR